MTGLDPKYKTCGNCKGRRNGFCVGSFFYNGRFVEVSEWVDKEEPACTLFDPIPKSQLTNETPSPVNTRQLVKTVRCCGECAFFLNGVCMNKKLQIELGLDDRPKVEYYGKACKRALSVLEEST